MILVIIMRVISCRDVSTDELSRLWAEFGEQFAFNELRSVFPGRGLFSDAETL